MRELLAHAASLGVSVHVAHIEPPTRGYFDADRAQIVIDFNLTPIERNSVLAHELGHAFYGHRCYGNRAYEAAADLYAARMLIDPAELQRASVGSPSLTVIAEELGVELRLLHTFLEKDVQQFGTVTYVRPRMGRGQSRYCASISLGE